ncbi:MAG: hypothetical protein RBT35_07745 [Bacteroidales bacterium]|jgi:hypothetical protein|nr:hypothetical protein [Bacteroidales bacterium]
MKKLLLLGIVLLSFTFADAQRGKNNPYHTPGTKEYIEETAKMIGTWNIESFVYSKKEKIGEVYTSGTLEIPDPEQTGKREIILRFELPRDVIDSRIKAWNKKGETISVDSYAVIVKYDLRIHNKGTLIYLENPSSTADIKGSGEQLENFINTEYNFIASQTSMKEEGGLSGMLGAKLMQSATGIDFIPRVNGQMNYKDLTDNSFELISAQKTTLKLKR